MLGRVAFLDARVFRNATTILLSAAGNSKTTIAYELGCSPATVDNVRQRYRQHGIKGLIPQTSPSRPSRATTQYRAALRQEVETPPPSLSYGFRVWSSARLILTAHGIFARRKDLWAFPYAYDAVINCEENGEFDIWCAACTAGVILAGQLDEAQTDADPDNALNHYVLLVDAGFIE